MTPFLSVLFIFEFIKLIVPPLSRWETSEPGHAQTLSRIVYLLALVFAGFQARGVTGALQDAGMLIDGPGWGIVTPLTLVGGTALLLWLGERITLHGLGNGFWLIVIAPMLSSLISNTARTFELIRMGAVTSGTVIAELAFFAVAATLLVKSTQAGAASTESRVSGADFINIWPPLLAAFINDYKVTLSGVEINFAAQLALLAAVIALLNGLQWLGTAPAARRPVWAIALVQIFICVGAELLTHIVQLPFPISGAWFIVIVMTAMSFVRAFGPMPEPPNAKPAV